MVDHTTQRLRFDRSAKRRRPARTRAAAIVLVLALCGSAAGVASAQPLKNEDKPAEPTAPRAAATPTPSLEASMQRFEDRPIRSVRILGLTGTDAGLVQNQVRSREGAALSPTTVREDVQRLNRLGRFRQIDAKVESYDDGTVGLVYSVVETPVIEDVQAVGNRQLADAEIGPVINLLKGTPIDEFQLGAAKAAIEKLYREKGYFQATVTVDQEELEKNRIVLFRIAEGERVRVTAIQFEGNSAFSERQLSPSVKTKTAGLFETGPVDNEQIERDVQSIVTFYRDRGYLDVRADKQIVFAPNGREAIVRFVIEEGPLYTLRSVKLEVLTPDQAEEEKPKIQSQGVLSREQVAGLMEIKVGDVYSIDKMQRSIDLISNAYKRMGYVDAQVIRTEKRDPERPVVDVIVGIREGRAFNTGLISVKGNDITQDKVILRALQIKPDRPLSLVTTREGGVGEGSRQVIKEQKGVEDARLFAPGSVRMTVQKEDPQSPGTRDVIVEVQETNTGSLAFGVGAGSDSGLFGQISLNQRNFDVADTPESFAELISGRAFRGAGQEFNITLAPGIETQTYSMTLADPNLLDTDYGGSVTGFFRTRDFDEYNEERLGFRAGIGRRFGDRWQGTLSFRYEHVRLSDLEPSSTVDLFDLEGSSALGTVGFSLSRTTIDSRFRPTKGNRFEIGVERAGALGGDFDYTKITAQNAFYIPLYESFLGYKTVLSLRQEIGYVPEGQGKVPLFERFYRGGTSFRGYRFRTISPKGIRNDTRTLGVDPVGGSWMFFANAEIQQPVFRDLISVVGFIDTGTVTDKIGFKDYRVSGGFGIRLYVSQLSPVPIAFDFGFPIVKVNGDRERVFSFSLDLPF